MSHLEDSPDQHGQSNDGGKATAGAALTVGGVSTTLILILIQAARELKPTEWFVLAALLLSGAVVIFGLGVVAAGVVLAVIRPDPGGQTGAHDTNTASASLLLTGLGLVTVGAISVAIALLTT